MSDRSTKSEYRDVRAPRGKHHWVVIPANRKSSAVLSDLRSLCNGPWHAPSELTRDQAVRQFVAVVRLSWKMGRENLAATIDRFANRFAGSIGSQSIGDDFRDLLPGRGLDFRVDSPISKHFYPMLEERDQNQYARVIPGVMETVLSKRSKRQCVNRRFDAIFGGDEPLDAGYLA